MRDFTRAKHALLLYDAALAVFNSDTFPKLSNAAAWAFYEELCALERQVCREFIAATSDVNSPDKADVIGVGPWLREILADKQKGEKL